MKARHQRIAEMAYQSWELAGRPQSNGVVFWLAAEMLIDQHDAEKVEENPRSALTGTDRSYSRRERKAARHAKKCDGCGRRRRFYDLHCTTSGKGASGLCDRGCRLLCSRCEAQIEKLTDGAGKKAMKTLKPKKSPKAQAERAKPCSVQRLDMRHKAEALACRFHETYERLAPSHGYETRKASAVPWADVPEKNKSLMIAVCAEFLPQRQS